MERRQSSVVPLLLIVGLIFGTVGVAGYYLMQNRKVVTSQEVSTLAARALEAQGPVVLNFHTGMVKASATEKPGDPQYRLLEKIGLVTLGKPTGPAKNITPVTLTAKGKEFLGQIAGVQQTTESDGTVGYATPLASRQLVSVSNIRLLSIGHAVADITWKWQTTALGEFFEASGPTVKGFSTWDRSLLIDKYGANFYHSDPTRATLAFVRNGHDWQIAE
ncbi:MAG: hypothetical protein JST79_04480 [Acidobacteria bacterium]|nr:hypothetical protein [Acidobacteriota bacterium]